MSRHGLVRVARSGLVAAVLAVGALGLPALSTAASGASSAASSTVWLCRPGLPSDPCTTPENATAVSASGGTRVLRARPATNPPIDCFYVYPTVSDELTANSNLTIQPAETDVAIDQASRFSSVCKVYAPMYNQLTLAAITGRAQVTAADGELAYTSALSGFEDYLKHYNHGRGFVLIGHSQGASILIQLIERVVDDVPSVRKHLVSAIILGGNVDVPIGKSVGGSFAHVPACRAATETGCVVAYSSFLDPPPTDSIFGRVGQGVSALSGQRANAKLQVLCVNPAALTGGAAAIEPFFLAGAGEAAVGVQGTPTTVTTPWVTYPGLYRAQCISQGGATWLQITPKPGDPRPVIAQILGPTWGTHLGDVNLTLGNLVSLVAAESKAYAARH